MLASRRSQALTFTMLVAIVALVAQLAGVGSTRPDSGSGGPTAQKLAVLPGSAVPDIGSTSLASTTATVAAGTTVRMQSEATVSGSLSGDGVAQIVCGIRYSRDNDPSWTLGTPYETVTLRTGHTSEKVKIERSFAAPAADTYRTATVCHVSSGSASAAVSGTGSMRLQRGLPEGSDTPIRR